MNKSKSSKPHKETHTANTKYGMGDYYGTGVRNPVGRVRETMGFKPLSPLKLKKPPKALA